MLFVCALLLLMAISVVLYTREQYALPSNVLTNISQTSSSQPYRVGTKKSNVSATTAYAKNGGATCPAEYPNKIYVPVGVGYQTSMWGTCDTSCTKRRTARCVASDGLPVQDYACTMQGQVAPTNLTSTCMDGEGSCFYSWNAGGWSAVDGNCMQYRTVSCKRGDGVTVDDWYCSGQSKPSTSQVNYAGCPCSDSNYTRQSDGSCKCTKSCGWSASLDANSCTCQCPDQGYVLEGNDCFQASRRTCDCELQYWYSGYEWTAPYTNACNWRKANDVSYWREDGTCYNYGYE